VSTTTHPPGEGVATVDRRDLAITGMTCASCVANVESALRGVSGVKSADVNLATERASVQLDPTRADVPALVRAVERAGYGALALSADQKERAVVEDRERAARRAQLVSLRRRLVVAAVLASLTMIVAMADLLIGGSVTLVLDSAGVGHIVMTSDFATDFASYESSPAAVTVRLGDAAQTAVTTFSTDSDTARSSLVPGDSPAARRVRSTF